jgi:hypothetical protein
MVNIVPGGRGSCCKGERRQPRRRYIYCADPGNPQAGTREASRTTRSRQAADRMGHHQRRQLHYTRLTPTLSSFYTRASHGRAHLWHLRCRRSEELGWQGSRANEGRRHVVQWRRRGIQRTITATRTSRIRSDTVTTGWRVHRGYFALRLGLRRHRPLYRPVRCWSRMVRTTDMKEGRRSAT